MTNPDHTVLPGGGKFESDRAVYAIYHDVVRNFAEIASLYQRFAEAEAHGAVAALPAIGPRNRRRRVHSSIPVRVPPGQAAAEPAVRRRAIRMRRGEGLGAFPHLAARKSEDNTRRDDETSHANQ